MQSPLSAKKAAIVKKDIDLLIHLDKRLTKIKGGINKMTTNKEQCQLCFNNNINCIITPCGHRFGCKDCLDQWREKSNECPFCREEIVKLINI